MRLDTRKIAFLVLALLGLLAANYILGLFGINTGRMITEYRCRSGAFVPDTTGAAGFDSNERPPVASEGPAQHPASQVIADPAASNLFSNPGLEEGAATPDSWLTSTYGQNDASFTTVPGHASGRAGRVEIRSYSNGAADWYHLPVEAAGGQYYRYSDFYRSNVTTRAVLMVVTRQGDTHYIDLKAAAPAPDWSGYGASFFVPQDAVRLLVFRPLNSAGWLETDDHVLTKAQAQGFARPLVTLTFDDGWKSIHENALPLLDRYQMPSTQYIVAGYVGKAQSYMDPVDIYDLRERGHEINSHTVSHLDLTKAPASVVEYELEQGRNYLGKCFGTPTGYAAPYGADDETTLRAIRDLYQTARSTDSGYNTADNLDPYRLQVQRMTAGTSPAEVESWLELTRNNRAWLILVYHQVDDGSSAFARRPTDLERDLQAIRSSGITVATIHDAYAEIKSQVP